mgnify:CR=1 FL=1
MTRLRWFGHATVRLEMSDRRFLFDPLLAGGIGYVAFTALPAGRLHLVSQIRRQMEDIFIGLGFAVLELDYVRPFDRPGQGWMWQFNLTPGW